MDKIEIAKLLLSAFLGLLFAELWRRWQTGKKRITYEYDTRYVWLQNSSKITLKEREDVAKNDPIRIPLSSTNIAYANKDLKEGKNINGFYLSDEGYLHFDYWESKKSLLLFLETTEEELETNNKVYGTLIDGEIISKEKLDKRNVMFQAIVTFLSMIALGYRLILDAYPSLGNNLIVSQYIPLAIIVCGLATFYFSLFN